MNYKRIFGLKPSAMFTIDPGTFEVTNQFDYADLKKLKVRALLFIAESRAVVFFQCGGNTTCWSPLTGHAGSG